MGESLVTKDSPWSVDETVERLATLIESKCYNLFAVLQHSGAAA